VGEGNTNRDAFGPEWDEVAREAREAENGTSAHDFVTLKRRG
jgi:hypothetical protein